jgi:hypothetical protein
MPPESKTIFKLDPRGVKSLEKRLPQGGPLKAKDWQQKVPLALRQRAQFSAQLENVRVIREIKTRLDNIANQIKESTAQGDAFVGQADFISDVRKIAIDQGLSDGSAAITNIASIPRLALIYDTQTSMASGYGRYMSDLNPDALDEFPAQELIRIEDRKELRDWPSRWRAEGGDLIDGRMVALKTDPIWAAISYFGTPYPPFDFNSGMGLMDLDRTEAIDLGLIDDSYDPTSEDAQEGAFNFNDALEASAENLTPEDETFLRKTFGDRIEFENGRVKWRGE